MNKTTTKRNKKEEQKKLAVRIVCLTLVVALAVTSLLTVFPTLFQDNTGGTTFTIEELAEMGLIELDEEGNIISFDESLFADTDDHEGHDHD